MKVLEEGTPWTKEFYCTGKGNNETGCGAKLLVEEPDLFQTKRSDWLDISADYFVTFQCPKCTVLTDIPPKSAPQRQHPFRKPNQAESLKLR